MKDSQLSPFKKVCDCSQKWGFNADFKAIFVHQRVRIVVENMDSNMFLDNDFITRNCDSNMIWLKKQGVKRVCLLFGIHLT